jgi:ABC-type branched-subunit amino acid transport system permease subunit
MTRSPIEKREDLLALAAFAGLLVLPWLVESWRLIDVSIYLTYAMLAASLAFVWGHVGLLCLGQAVFFGLGAYAMSFVTMGMVPGLEHITSSYVGLVAAVLVPAVAGALIGWFVFSAKGLHGAFFGVVTLAIAVVAEKLFVNWSFAGGLNGLIGVPSFMPVPGDTGEVTNEYAIYAIAVAALVGTIVLYRMVQRSDFGLILASIRSRESRTLAFGFDTARLKTLAFALAAGVSGLAGALFVTQFNFASPTLIGFNLSAEALIWVALGGRRSVVTAALGAIGFRALEANLSGVVGDTWLLMVGALFILAVLVAPNGLFGTPLAGWRQARSG